MFLGAHVLFLNLWNNESFILRLINSSSKIALANYLLVYFKVCFLQGCVLAIELN